MYAEKNRSSKWCAQLYGTLYNITCTDVIGRGDEVFATDNCVGNGKNTGTIEWFEPFRDERRKAIGTPRTIARRWALWIFASKRDCGQGAEDSSEIRSPSSRSNRTSNHLPLTTRTRTHARRSRCRCCSVRAQYLYEPDACIPRGDAVVKGVPKRTPDLKGL